MKLRLAGWIFNSERRSGQRREHLLVVHSGERGLESPGRSLLVTGFPFRALN
jgi:hypothetical protein